MDQTTEELLLKLAHRALSMTRAPRVGGVKSICITDKSKTMEIGRTNGVRMRHLDCSPDCDYDEQQVPNHTTIRAWSA